MAMVVGLRGSGLNLFCAVGMFFAGMLFSVPPAAADDFDVCSKESGDIAASACSRAITSGRYNGPKLAILNYNRGTVYATKGQYDRAIEDFDQAIRLNPQDADVFNNRGIAFKNKGQYDRAIQDYDQAIKLNPDKAGAFNNRGKAYANKGQYDRAIQDYDQAIRLNPNLASAIKNRSEAIAKKNN